MSRRYDPISKAILPASMSDDEGRRHVALRRWGEGGKGVYVTATVYETVWYNGQPIRENRHSSSAFMVGNTTSSARSTYSNYKNMMHKMEISELPSWHTFPQSVLDSYWWGTWGICTLKVTEEKTWAKITCKIEGAPVGRPNDPRIVNIACGLICDSERYIEEDYDIYFVGSRDAVQDWAASQGLTYPCDTEADPWIYGAVYENNVLTGLKAYIINGYI